MTNSRRPPNPAQAARTLRDLERLFGPAKGKAADLGKGQAASVKQISTQDTTGKEQPEQGGPHGH